MESGCLRLNLLGRFNVAGDFDGAPPSGKAERLLKVLAANHGQLVPVETLVEALWGDQYPDRPERNIATLISRLRRSLGRDRIVGGPGGYRLVLDKALSVDLFEAEELVAEAERELVAERYSLAVLAAESAERLLATGIPLADESEAQWAQQVRRLAQFQLRKARESRWAAALKLGAAQQVVDAASAALDDDALDEPACRALMRGYQLAGKPGAALSAYQNLRANLVQELGSDPSLASHELFLEILRGEVSDPGTDGAPPSPELGDGQLIGREPEVAELLRLWSAATESRSGMALVLGEAGIGKTALAEELAARVRRTGGLVVSATCYQAERSLYLQPLVDAVRAIIATHQPSDVLELAGDGTGTLIELVPELAKITGRVPYQRGAGELEHRRSLEALAGLVRRLCVRQPVLLLLDDMQYAGQATVEALHFFANRLGDCRLLVLVAERVLETPPAAEQLRDLATTLSLGPLSREAVTTLVRNSGLPYNIDTFYEWTGGSPLCVTELLRHPIPVRGSEQVELRIPDTLHDAVSDRLVRAGDEVTLLLQQGAILGVRFAVDDVADLSGVHVEECARRAERALSAGLLVADGDTFRFANDIVRQVAYDSTPQPVLVSRHRRAAKLFAGRPEAAARHLLAAADWGRAVTALGQAAESAHFEFSNTEADRLLSDAVDAAQRAEDPALLASVLLRRGEIRTELGRLSAAKDDHEAALQLARDLDDEALEARALEHLGWTALYTRDALGAVDLAARASHLAESAAAAPGALPSAQLLLGRVRHWDGDYPGASAAYREVLDTRDVDAVTAAMALAYQGALLQHTDRFDEAQATLERAAILCRDAGLLRPLLQTLFFTSLARGDTGDFEGALRALNRARHTMETYDVGYYRAGIETTTSWLWQELGDVERARGHAEIAVELAHRGGGALELEQELHALLALADCDLMQGRDDDAAARVEAATPLLDQPLPFRPRATMRLWEMRARWAPEEADALLDEARAHASTKYEALALRHLGRHEEAATTAAATGSALVIAQAGAPAARRAACDRIAARLPSELRDRFVRSGRLFVALDRQ